MLLLSLLTQISLKSKLNLLKAAGVAVLSLSVVSAGQAQAQTELCFGAADIGTCSKIVGGFTVSNFVFSNFTLLPLSFISIESLTPGVLSVSFAQAPNIPAPVASGANYSFTVSAPPGSFASAVANITGGGTGSFSTTLSSASLTADSTATNSSIATLVSFASGSSPGTSMTFTQSFSLTTGSSIGSLGATFTAPPPSAAPGPLPLLGAAAAFSYSRKLRKAIKAGA